MNLFIKKIRRFFDSKNFNAYDIYDSIINFVIENYKIKHTNNPLHITIDHMFCRDKFATLMFTLRIGKQSIPLWLTIIGVDYSKNKKSYLKKLKIRDTKKTKTGNIKRIISFFNLGLTIFNKLLNSIIDLKLKCNFILYDI